MIWVANEPLVKGCPRGVEELLASTGSTLDPAGTALYQRLIRDPDHVDATLKMMAQWSIDGLLARLAQIPAETVFLVGARDGAVPPKIARRAAEKMPDAGVVEFAGEGHLIHETAPDVTAAAIRDFVRQDRSQPSSA